MQINKYKNLGKGWFSESQRHSNAKLYGSAGGLYAKNKDSQYKLIMKNEDDGGRREVLVTGTLKECESYLKDEINELKEDEDIDIVNVTKDSAEGVGHRGNFSYEIVGKNKKGLYAFSMGKGRGQVGKDGIVKVLSPHNEGVYVKLIAMTDDKKEAVGVMMNKEFAGNLDWGETVLVKDTSDKNIPKIIKRVDKVPNTKKWNILGVKQE